MSNIIRVEQNINRNKKSRTSQRFPFIIVKKYYFKCDFFNVVKFVLELHNRNKMACFGNLSKELYQVRKRERKIFIVEDEEIKLG